MDKSWMQLNRSSPCFAEGVEEIIRFAYSEKQPHEKIPCPCYTCNNFCHQTQEVVRYHLSINGIKRIYVRWTYHGESYEDNINDKGNIEENFGVDDSDDDCNVDDMVKMLNDISNAYIGDTLGIEEPLTTPGAPFPLGRADIFLKLLNDSEEKLYKVFVSKGRPFGGPIRRELNDSDWKAIHLFVLKICEEIEEYRSEHMAQLKAESELSVDQLHDTHFPKWFRKRVEELRVEGLATGFIPNTARIIKTSQNSGVMVEGEHNQKIVEFYGVITDIIEMGGPEGRVTVDRVRRPRHSEEGRNGEELIMWHYLKEKNANEKLTIDIPKEVNRFVGINSQYAITESRCLIRRFAPLKVTKWAKIDEDKKHDLLRDFKEEKKGDIVGPIELYKLTHYKCVEGSDEGSWISDIAEDNHASNSYQ
ncbi:hypothetical protein BUALT_Bualt07G0068600 [Buddleja alternifolia]|uniref:Transposase-associated domain-containing protein n=1 Tax=Buddleja alternifolia TaxID=168488 RepID=A0AAV6XJN2_9LAMI|nr:hypothetical protein BUALT_Bualt07G0068600 [Buddleja alternifolia]